MADPSKSDPPDELQMPEPIPDTPENIMKAILATPPKKRKDWKFMQERESRDGDPV